jgi:redox-sensitive bicupin YhaK (pirin superfamily)
MVRSMPAVLAAAPLASPPWPTPDPFLFCVHHVDAYPAGNAQYGPNVPLKGRNIGQDFANKDGWNMYHGDVVPGFPQHPHRGFETVTIVRRGLIDHSDSLGAQARFGHGDVQWLTAGAGIVHSEMFPLLEREAGNPTELFQIWLNLPPADKLAEPHFAMLWNESIPTATFVDDAGRSTSVRVVAGSLAGIEAPPPPPPRSWAARAEADVAIWTIAMEPGATWTLPPARAGTNRALYYFAGSSLTIEGEPTSQRSVLMLDPEAAVPMIAGPDPVELLLLQGRPIGQPVAQQGPFVMNTRAEIEQAFADYRRTRFGGWPWPSNGPVHGGEPERHARRTDGTIERPPRG